MPIMLRTLLEIAAFIAILYRLQFYSVYPSTHHDLTATFGTSKLETLLTLYTWNKKGRKLNHPEAIVYALKNFPSDIRQL